MCVNHALARWVSIQWASTVGDPIGRANFGGVRLSKLPYLCRRSFGDVQLLFHTIALAGPNQHRRSSGGCWVVSRGFLRTRRREYNIRVLLKGRSDFMCGSALVSSYDEGCGHGRSSWGQLATRRRVNADANLSTSVLGDPGRLSPATP